MNLIKSLTRVVCASRLPVLPFLLATTMAGLAQTSVPVLQVHADKVTAKMPPTFYGLMTEEINYAYEGGLYGELVRNRAFKADAIQQPIKPENYDPAKHYPVKIAVKNPPKFWSAINGAKISLDTNTVLNEALNVSLKVEINGATKNLPAGVANGGYWGIPVKPNTTYHASFYAKSKHFNGPLTVSLVHRIDPKDVTVKTPPGFEVHLGEAGMPVASAVVQNISDGWQKYEVTLTTGDIEPSKDNQLVITTTKAGTFFHHDSTIWLQQVSLFPPTYKDRPNGDRADLSQLLADAQPKFLRFPGGNFVEGDYFNERFNWKETIGPVEQRPGHRSCWGYWATDGFGLPEFLGWCEDLHMEPVLAVFAGYTLRHDHVAPGDSLEPYVQEALEEIEYVTGDATTTKWGAQRAKDGHPAPFTLHYVEIGNEDWFDISGSYDGRFAQFYDAIKAKYPQLKLISTAGYERPEAQRIHSRTPDLVDEHYYRSEEEMESQSFVYDKRDRSNPTKIFVGEWATRVGSPTPNMAGALGDAAWMCCMERNADIVMMHCYAPLFVNVSDLGAGRSMQWKSDLIGYDALNSYGSPSYYAQKIFSLHQGDEVLGIDAQDLPTYTWIQNGRTRNGTPLPARTNEVKSLFYSATHDTASGKIIVKVVNRADAAQEVNVQISGVAAIADAGTATVLKADNRGETNTIDDPKHVLPVTEAVTGLGTSFTRSFPPCSITILELSAKQGVL
ncbi:MAG TPA: alpha-L-arabinofuranosidase C-terminal domain-containing protein [Candidatus Acidoferrales bacterium]|nr:alpha-L-arabinofuranosidase C-terminal domain-containing protein [Candidatus Acidoferrales bacterium]